MPAWRPEDGRRDPYERRRPEETTLYQPVREHLETFLTQGETGAGLPDRAKDVLIRTRVSDRVPDAVRANVLV
ncbi:MAG: hypothetical protein ACREXK_00955 [Gammaproteobacteria bacterium]